MNYGRRLKCYDLCVASYAKAHPKLYQLDGVELIVDYDKLSNTTYIAFRGSRGWYDWRRNLRFLAKKTPFGKVHGGYWKEANALSGRVSMLIPSGSHVIWCWHSRGVMGQLFAALIHKARTDLVFVEGIGFGVPKIFKGVTVDVPECINRVNKKDLVTRMPFFGGWHHHGPIEQLDESVAGSEHPLSIYGRFNHD